MQSKPKTNQQVEISIYKGDKLLNENTPFVVNLIGRKNSFSERIFKSFNRYDGSQR